MLIEFRVKNFRSLRDEQVLTLVASKDNSLSDTNTLTTGIKAVPRLLPSAVIYGANASGKSNVIKALRYMRSVVIESATVMQPGQTFDVQPFRLDPSSENEPTEFEVTFILDGVRYQYGFTMTSERIVREYLLVYKSFKPQQWFERHYDEESDAERFEFGTGLKGTKNLWESATRPNSLFLSMAVQLNSDDLRPAFEWFAHELVIINEESPLDPQLSIRLLKQEEGKKQICDFLAAADISIADIEVVSTPLGGSLLSDLLIGKTDIRTKEKEEKRLRFTHVTSQGKAEFRFEDESGGTRILVFLAGMVLDILEKGRTLVFDELDTSLHTLLVRELVKRFHRPDLNRRGAQLIFTTHDTSLLDVPYLFRRDQIWLVEKDNGQVSRLVALAEFSPRKNEALGKGYLSGRYGGIPFLSNDSMVAE